MVDFQFYNPCRIVFGKNNESKLPELIRNLGGSRVLMHYGGGSIKKNGVYDRVTSALKEGGITFFELGGVQPNPRLALVRKGIELVKEQNIDFILAVGGGSVIDSSKAIAVGVYQEDVWDCFVKGVYPTKALPVGVVLTLAGGFQDAYSYNCRGQVFANAQTGNIVLLGQNAAMGSWGQRQLSKRPPLPVPPAGFFSRGIPKRMGPGAV